MKFLSIITSEWVIIDAMNKPNPTNDAVELLAPARNCDAEILTPAAIAFVASLHGQFNERRLKLLKKREEFQAGLDQGDTPGFLEETRGIREGRWKVRPAPADLLDRRVEITGPVERKMIINALNSGAQAFMADFEDSCSPTWANLLDGQINLRDAVAGTISFEHPQSGKQYALGEKVATLIVRPRGWHLEEKHMRVDGVTISASLFDFGLYFFHNAAALLEKGSGPYFYLPKLENHLEARLWNDVFVAAQEMLGLKTGTIRATVLIETISAAFEMDEILHELRDHCVGLNCGRWDYIFSFIKKFRNRPDFVLPDRAAITMERHFLKSYTELLIKICHRRGAHAMGGMAAQIPIKGDEAANAEALARVRADKEREANAGHDGTWVAHPGLIPVALAAFDAVMKGPNQFDVLRADVDVAANDLLKVPQGAITVASFRHNIRVGVQYLATWLGGNGCVPMYHLMEDTATAEICRAQLWQWLRHRVVLDSGEVVTPELFDRIFCETMISMQSKTACGGVADIQMDLAAKLFSQMVKKESFDEFLTVPAYQYLD